MEAQAEKASSCPFNSSPSPVEDTRMAPSAANLSSTAWANAQKFGYIREPRPNTQNLCGGKKQFKQYILYRSGEKINEEDFKYWPDFVSEAFQTEKLLLETLRGEERIIFCDYCTKNHSKIKWLLLEDLFIWTYCNSALIILMITVFH